MRPDDAVTPQAIARCEKIIRPYIRRTPVIAIDGSEFGLPAGPLALKLELLQHSGSFKARGAFTNLLTREIPKAGVVAASGGNHGAAVAYAAMRLGKPAKIFVPSVSSPAKIARIREYGADLTIDGDRYADALAASEAWARQTGAMPVPAFDQNETIMGQGTLGARTRGAGARYRHGSGFRGRRRAGRGDRRLVRRPHQGHRRRAVGLADADQSFRGRTSRRCRSRRAGGGFAGAAACRRTRVSDRPEIRAAHRAGDPTTRSPRRRRRCGAPCASWRSRVAPAHSPRSLQARIGRPPANASRSSSAAATRRRSISTSRAEPVRRRAARHCGNLSRPSRRDTAQFLLDSSLPECIRIRIAYFSGILDLIDHALPCRRRFALFVAAVRLAARAPRRSSISSSSPATRSTSARSSISAPRSWS